MNKTNEPNEPYYQHGYRDGYVTALTDLLPDGIPPQLWSEWHVNEISGLTVSLVFIDAEGWTCNFHVTLADKIHTFKKENPELVEVMKLFDLRIKGHDIMDAEGYVSDRT